MRPSHRAISRPSSALGDSDRQHSAVNYYNPAPAQIQPQVPQLGTWSLFGCDTRQEEPVDIVRVNEFLILDPTPVVLAPQTVTYMHATVIKYLPAVLTGLESARTNANQELQVYTCSR